MKQRIITLFLTIGCIVLGIVSFFVYVGQDHTAPEISIKKKSITYTEGESYDVLLNGVSAKDDVDGEISNQLFISKIIPSGDGKAIVHYAVTDAANNVGIAKRKVYYVASLEKDAEVKEENIADEEIATEDEIEEKAEEKDDEEKANDTEEQSEETSEELKPDGSKPAIVLLKEKMTIKVGESFDKLGVVKDVVDDKDDKTNLYQHIHADGNINTNKKGSYKITYYVTDSDGNASEKKIFTLTVK